MSEKIASISGAWKTVLMIEADYQLRRIAPARNIARELTGQSLFVLRREESPGSIGQGAR